ncbi:MAG: glutamate--tRNA ligase [Planctomycetota bacterium]|nr:glutamate--tRNA ligase [Planctomycetota bacterium]
MTQPIRVRFAPSPTGKLHIGGARTALFNWAYARGRGGKFLLRIEDTDPERSTKENEVAILEGLRWLGLDWDEGPDIGGPFAPYHQTLRLPRHKELAQVLFEKGWAYRCFCTRERIEQLNAELSAKKERIAYDGLCRRLSRSESDARARDGSSFTLRFAVPEGKTRFKDHVRGDVEFANEEVEDWVMVRSDGNPTYNFVVVCDDVDMQISHVFRGEEHLVNTPKQVLLYKAFERQAPEFGHLPLMLGTDKKKLSKRTGDTALSDYRDQGFPRDATVNFLCLQGWALDGSTEVFGVDQLVAKFDIKDVNKAGAIFDIEKFTWLAGEYIRRDSLEHLADIAKPWVVAKGLATEAQLDARRDWYLAVVAGVKERVHTYSELADQITYLFVADESLIYDEPALKGAKKHEKRIETLRAFHSWLGPRVASGVDAASLREGAKQWVADQGLKMPALFQPLRCALTGQAGGPDLFDTMTWLGGPSTLRRIELGFERLV